MKLTDEETKKLAAIKEDLANLDLDEFDAAYAITKVMRKAMVDKYAKVGIQIDHANEILRVMEEIKIARNSAS